MRSRFLAWYFSVALHIAFAGSVVEGFYHIVQVNITVAYQNPMWTQLRSTIAKLVLMTTQETQRC